MTEVVEVEDFSLPTISIPLAIPPSPLPCTASMDQHLLPKGFAHQFGQRTSLKAERPGLPLRQNAPHRAFCYLSPPRLVALPSSGPSRVRGDRLPRELGVSKQTSVVDGG